MGKDYYAILGLSKDFTPEDLKKAYRKAATKYHPDKVKGSEQDKQAGAEKFKEVGEAYDVLSDPQKRQVYDMYGEEGLKGGVPPSGAGGPEGFRGGYSFSPDMANSIFEELFGGMGMGGMGGMGGRRRARGGMGGMFGGMGGPGAGFSFFGPGFGDDEMMSDQGMGGGPRQQEVDLPIPLEQLFTGTTKKLKVTRRIVDASSGRMVPVQEVVEIAIKPGWKEGTRITFEGKGDERPGGAPSDLVFVIKEQKHPRFTRKGNNLHTTVTIPLVTALAGGTVSIQHFNKTLPLQLRDVISPGQERAIGGEGMPISKTPGKRGDLVVRFEVSFPRSLTEDQKSKLRTLLPSS